MTASQPDEPRESAAHLDAGSFSSEELRVFLEEADEQISTLDTDLVELEQSTEKQQLIEELFRAAHTLKGSSGMLGLESMAAVTHAMEGVLDRVRSGALSASPVAVDLLLESVDVLKELRGGLEDNSSVEPPVADLIEALSQLAESSEGLNAEPSKEGGAGPNEPEALAFVVDPAAEARASDALAEGHKVVIVSVEIGGDPGWCAVRAFQVVGQLDRIGAVLASEPSSEAIEQGEAAGNLRALVTHDTDDQAVDDAARQVEDVLSVAVADWVPVSPVSTERAERSPVQSQERGRSEEVNTVRISVDLLDRLMNLGGELVIDRTRIAQLSRQISSGAAGEEVADGLEGAAGHLGKVVDDLNEVLGRARMWPVGLVFSPFPRLVRDLARSLEKEVHLDITGADTEIDRSVLEKLKDPLVHMLRNSVDHGAETAVEREAVGKPGVATIRLAAWQEHSRIYIAVADDGRGIDAERAKETAVSKGLVSSEAAALMSDDEAVRLVLLPGLSTRTEASSVSGRGVGLDVLSQSVAALGGEITIESTRGQGSVFTLSLPLTLATFPGLLVSAGGVTFAIPLSYVVETVRNDQSLLRRVGGRSVLSLRGSVLAAQSLCGDGLRPYVAEDRVKQFFVVLKLAEVVLAVAVDDLIDQQEIVVKPLGPHAGRRAEILGASILGDGRIALILDVAGMLRAARVESEALRPKRENAVA